MSPLPAAFALVRDGHTYQVRPAGPGDLEVLRAWRNAHAQAFYDSRPIDADAQRAWFARFSADPAQWLYVVEDSAGPVGCLGLKVTEGTPEAPRCLALFNVLHGEARTRGTGLMGAFYATLAAACAAAGVEALEAEVRADNAGVLRWYVRQGFTEIARRAEGHVLRHVLRADA
jgi:ribosomal protein S18 acetylase RimI-like enzyme